MKDLVVSEHIDSPYVEFDRQDWSALASSTPLPLTNADIERLRGLGDPIDLHEVNVIFRPLSRLLNLYSRAIGSLHQARGTFLREQTERTPYVIGVAGSVAVGKSTVARVLVELLKRWPDTPRVELLTTDGFLYPNAELTRRGIMDRKGFPESYDRRSLLRFLTAVKAGQREVSAPVYSHLIYDIVPGERNVVRRPDILVVEGLNVLQPPRLGPDDHSSMAVSDFFDFSIYIDARDEDARSWYIDRFLQLRATSFSDPDSYFRRYADIDDEEAVAIASHIWDTINRPNLEQNIRPTRGRADLVLTKGTDHSVRRIRLRKL